MIFQTFDHILGSAVNSKISEISDILAQMNTSSTEYALLTSVKDMLGSISSLLQTSSRRVRRAASELTKYFLEMFFSYRSRLWDWAWEVDNFEGAVSEYYSCSEQNEQYFHPGCPNLSTILEKFCWRKTNLNRKGNKVFLIANYGYQIFLFF